MVKTIINEILHNSSKYRSKGSPITIVDHNSHSWTESVTTFPLKRTIRFYDGDIYEEINNISARDPVSVWLFHGDEADLSVADLSTTDESTFNPFVLPSGIIYWKESLQRAMKEIAIKYDGDSDELPNNCFASLLFWLM